MYVLYIIPHGHHRHIIIIIVVIIIIIIITVVVVVVIGYYNIIYRSCRPNGRVYTRAPSRDDRPAAEIDNDRNDTHQKIEN
jgi:hypothetical protein